MKFLTQIVLVVSFVVGTANADVQLPFRFECTAPSTRTHDEFKIGTFRNLGNTFLQVEGSWRRAFILRAIDQVDGNYTFTADSRFAVNAMPPAFDVALRIRRLNGSSGRGTFTVITRNLDGDQTRNYPITCSTWD